MDLNVNIPPEQLRQILQQISWNRVHKLSMRKVNFMRTEIIDGRPSHLFHCSICNTDLKSQYPRRGSSGVIGHCRSKRHQIRFMSVLYQQFRRLGGPALQNRWEMTHHRHRQLFDRVLTTVSNHRHRRQ